MSTTTPPSSSATDRAWLEIDGAALRTNLRTIREGIDASVRVIPMVKADGYGLGMLDVVRALEPEGPWGWGVATVAEGVHLREAGVRLPVVIFSPVPDSQYAVAVRNGLSVSVSGVQELEALARTASALEVEAAVHLEIDTGMGRAGLAWHRVPGAAPEVARMLASPWLTWEGLYTHFHSADEKEGPEVDVQWKRFGSALGVLTAESHPTLVHTCNSAAALRRPEYAVDAVRPGIFLYGGSAGSDQRSPEPVAALRARIGFIREAREGDTLGYGATYRASGPERWATVTIGYGDGLPRAVANGGRALVRGRTVSVIGRISMDVTVVDISDVDDAVVGDTVTLFGTDGTHSVDLGELASVAGTIDYEILTGITPRVSRVWTA